MKIAECNALIGEMREMRKRRVGQVTKGQKENTIRDDR